MRMAAEPGSGPFDAGTLAGRAWLAALPDELAAQRRVMAGLAARVRRGNAAWRIAGGGQADLVGGAWLWVGR